MFELASLTPIATMLLVLAFAGVISYLITSIAKGALKAYLNSTDINDKSPWWWNTLLRVVAVFIGMGLGILFLGWPLGAAIGFCGGGLNTLIFALVKKKLKSVNPISDSGEQEK